MNLGLSSKIAMIGGASKGLGYAVAYNLAAEGALVSIASRDAASIARAVSAIEQGTGGTALGVAADLSSADGIERWHAATIERFGGVDLLLPTPAVHPRALRSASTTRPGTPPSTCC